MNTDTLALRMWKILSVLLLVRMWENAEKMRTKNNSEHGHFLRSEDASQQGSKRMFFILQSHPSKGVQKKMVKARNFTRNKLPHRFIVNSL